MTKSFSKMENHEEVVKQSLSLQILGAQLLVQVRLPLHNKFQLLGENSNPVMKKCSCLIFKICDSLLWEARLPFHNKFQLLSKVKIRILSHEKSALGTTG